ncbi:MAG: AraC family ligand binding domain-containing protein [Dehalococcoidia bacterium]
MSEPAVTSWPHDEPPSEAALEALFRDEGLSPRWWSNGPGDRYAAHSHAYHKVLYCARGSIRFTIVPGGEHVDLDLGDRLDLPPGISHAAVVGPDGVTCMEAPKR